MLKELMATIGIGSAKVTLDLANPTVESGGTLEGIIKIKGGSVEQVVEKVYINLMLNSAYGLGSRTGHVNRNISTVSVLDKVTIMPEQEVSIPVQFKIPLNMPISKGRTKFYLLAVLDINQVINPKDSVPVTIIPNRYMKMVFEAFSTLGFKEKSGFGDYNGRYQEYAYIPTTFMAQELDEIELFPFIREQEISIAMNIFTKTWGFFSSDKDLEERCEQLRLPYKQIISSSQIAEMLKEIIQHEYRACS